jgi:hypothetical protein
MKIMKTFFPALVVALVLFAAILSGLSIAGSPATAAPAAAPTPVSVTRPGSGDFAVVTLFNAVPMTADTTSSCFDIGKFSLADVQYTIDQTLKDSIMNTTTLTTKWSVDGGTLVSGVNVVASNVADATDMQQVATFGRYFCLLADVSNANPVTVTARAIAK